MNDFRPKADAAQRKPSIVANSKSFARLVPRQFSDEFSLALRELKAKGIKLGVGAGLFVGALVFLFFLITGLIVAAIAGVAVVIQPLWLAALIVSAAFLVIALILALIGVAWFKKAMPLAPTETIRNVRHDLGVLKEGTDFKESTLDQKDKAKDDSKEEDHDEAPKKEKPAPVSDSELRDRISERREHLALLRDRLGEQADVKAQTERILNDPQSPVAQVKARWLPLSVAAASTTAFVVFLTKLIRKK